MPGRFRRAVNATSTITMEMLNARPRGTGNRHHPVERPSQLSHPQPAPTRISGSNRLAWTMRPKCPWAAAQTARVAPHKGHHSPVRAWNGHGGVKWCLKGSATVIIPAAAAKPAAPASGARQPLGVGRRTAGPAQLSASLAVPTACTSTAGDNPGYLGGARLNPVAGTLITTVLMILSLRVCFWASHSGKSQPM